MLELTLAIIGSRDFVPLIRGEGGMVSTGYKEYMDRCYLAAESYLLGRFPNHRIARVVSGRARGADTLGASLARRKGLMLLEFPADWATHGSAAGMLRNQDIIDAAHAVLAFPLGQSPGTRGAIVLAQKADKPVFICNFPDPPMLGGSYLYWNE